MLSKVFIIGFNGLHRMFIDRVALIFMFAAPLSISTIMGLVFGDSTNDVSVPDSDVIVVNLDEGTWGATYVDVLVEDTPQDMQQYITGEIGNDPDDARQQVEDGEVRAAVIIPANFSQQVEEPDTRVEIELYYNPGSEIGATIVDSIVQGITSGLNNVFVAQNILTGDGYFSQFTSDPAESGMAFGQIAQQLSIGDPSGGLIQMQDVNVQGEEDVNVISYFAPAMAILFMTFSMAAGTRTILEEQRDWTMQRIISTPTPRWVYLAGRLVGNYGTGLLQMLILIIVTPLVMLIIGGNANVWGTNYVGVALITVTVVFAGTGIGLLIAGVSKSLEQANTLSTVVLFLLAMLGGSFVPVEDVPALDTVSKLTLNYWGIDAYFDLATHGATVGDILPHATILTLMGAAFFGIALWRFNKRLDF